LEFPDDDDCPEGASAMNVQFEQVAVGVFHEGEAAGVCVDELHVSEVGLDRVAVITDRDAARAAQIAERSAGTAGHAAIREVHDENSGFVDGGAIWGALAGGTLGAIAGLTVMGLFVPIFGGVMLPAFATAVFGVATVAAATGSLFGIVAGRCVG
jgi:hypothetical protein